MKVAYYDLGSLYIKDFPSEEKRVPLRPTASQRVAVRILAEVTNKYPDTHWEIVGDGPWGSSRETLIMVGLARIRACRGRGRIGV